MFNKLLIASKNPGKVREIKELLEPLGVDVVSSIDFNLKEPEENGKDFLENAYIKAKAYSDATSLPSLSDDSGLSIDILDGEPGIYSARWAGKTKDFNIAINKIEKLVKEKTNNLSNIKAHFTCAMVLYNPVTNERLDSVGECFGKLEFPAKGKMGFGYDPIFIPNGYDKTFGEMDKDLKNKLSHRTIAISKLLDEIRKYK